MRKAPIGLVTLLLALGLTQHPAAADSWAWRDKGGGRGPLAIAGIRAGHASYGPNLTITFDRPLDPGAMGRKDFVVVDVEADGRGKSERWIYLVSVRGRLRSFSYDPKSGAVTPWSSRRPSRRSVVVPTLYDHEVRYFGGHGFAVGSYSETGGECLGGCWDVTPERGFLVHDYTAPDIVWFNTPTPHPDYPFWFRPTLPVSWRVEDRGLSGIRRVMLMTSEAGTGDWHRAATERIDEFHRVTFHKVRVPAVEGAHVMFQLVAEDGAGHVERSSISLSRIPYDQANDSAPGTFTGLWSEDDDPEAQGATVHTSTSPIDSLSFSGAGNTYCVILRWVSETGGATLEAGGSSLEITQPSYAGDYLWPYCVRTEEAEEHTATLTIQSGRLSVDGYWIGVDGPWASDGTLRPRAVAEGNGHGSSLPALRGPGASLEELKRVSRSTRPRLSRGTTRSRSAR